MNTTLDKIASNREEYSCNVDTLGECKIDSPVRHHDFIREGDRVYLTENIAELEYWETRLGHKPSFERAGPLRKIFHDPSWTRVGILTAGGLCPGLNKMRKRRIRTRDLARKRRKIRLRRSWNRATASSARASCANCLAGFAIWPPCEWPERMCRFSIPIIGRYWRRVPRT